MACSYSKSGYYDPMKHSPSYSEQQAKLLDWFDLNRREMPWRSDAGQMPDPYHVWLSEIMLQQTTVAAVEPYFKRFIERWPTVQDLAAADMEDVLAMWAGLGYYARARNLHACANAIVQGHAGVVPSSYAELIALPGVGPYTAAAVASIAFGLNYVAVDGNVERVTSRFFAIQSPLPKSRKEMKSAAEALGGGVNRPGDFTQAFMELGSQVCRPKNPKCHICPWKGDCKAERLGIAENLPVKTKKKPRPVKYANVYWIENEDGQVIVRRRPKTGILGGMMEFPNSDWGLKEYPLSNPPVEGEVLKVYNQPIIHIFTHLELHLKLYKMRFAGKLPDDTYQWCQVDKLADIGLPSLMNKVKERVLSK